MRKLHGSLTLKQEGIACPMTTLEEYFEKEDWSMIFNQ